MKIESTHPRLRPHSLDTSSKAMATTFNQNEAGTFLTVVNEELTLSKSGSASALSKKASNAGKNIGLN